MSNRKLYAGRTKLVLAFDIGTTHSGVSYSILQHGQPPEIHPLINEKKSVIKVPSLVYYGSDGSVKAVGIQALADHVSETAAKEGWRKAECWKLHLRPRNPTSPGAEPGDYVPPLPSGKTVVDVLTDFVKYLFQVVSNYIQSRHPWFNWSSVGDSIEFIFTHPNDWEGAQRQQYRRAVESAGLVPSTPEGRSRVRLITECEASLHYCANLLAQRPDVSTLGLVIINVGGGMIDLSMYSVAHSPISCAEVAPARCHRLDPVSTRHATPHAQPQLTASDSSPAAHHLQNNADEFRTAYYNLVFNTITDAFEKQRQNTTAMIDTAFLVGGSLMNDWLLTQLHSYFMAKGIELYWSADHPKTVTVGAVLSHIDRSPSQPLVTSRVARTTSTQLHARLPSASRDRWENQKHAEGAQSSAVDKIMCMIGLEHVKEQILNIKGIISTANRQGVPINKERLNVVLVGNPGTGKTTIARLYAEFLASTGALPGKSISETTGSKLSFGGVQGAKTLVDKALNVGGGTIFIDEAYQLVSDHDRSGRQVLDYLLDEMENKIGTLAFILAGYRDPMEKFFQHNPGLSSRFPYLLQFSDYTHKEFMLMLEDMVNKRYKGWMEVEGGIDGLYARIAIRRLVRGSGQSGFGNVRALENMFTKIRERQAERLERERKSRIQVDDFVLTKEDLIGPDPFKVLCDSTPWKKLQELIGLDSVKDSVRSMFRLLETNYQRELAEKEPIQVSLNRVFLGSPGTGKTSVAKLYGQILADLGMLSKGEVVVKNPSDFVAAHLGESEKNTKAILESTRGKVLVIDEAYMLYNKSSANSYHTAVIDTMVAEIQSVPGEDRCVLLLGYKDQMEEMFQNVNPGLARRFAIENAFDFEDFTETQLMQILELKLRQQDLHASEEAKRVAGEVLHRMKVRPNFGNAGEVDNLLGLAKARYQKRMASLPTFQTMDVTFEPQDFDPDFARSQVASENLDRIFADVVGCVEVKEKLGGYQRVALEMRGNGMDMHEIREVIPTSFIFKGPPGSGKTTIARKVGQVYYDMGFLASAEVVECSATDLTGQYVGHTGPKTKALFDKALGKVLFVDEAYRLSEGQYAKEAMEEIVGLITNERFMNKLVVILAGYEKEMNALLETNPGLSSRFSEEFMFLNLTPSQCLELLDQELQKKRVDVPALREETSHSYVKMQGIVEQMTVLPSWGNARDVKTLGKRMVRQAYTNMARHKTLSLSADEAFRVVQGMLEEQQARKSAGRTVISLGSVQTETYPMPPLYSPPRLSLPVTCATARDFPPVFRSDMFSAPMEQESQLCQGQARIESLEEDSLPQCDVETAQRDAGVSDAVWNQLRKDAEKQKRKTRTAEDVQVQQKLKDLGRCPMNFEWIRQANGYRCAGGSHFVLHGEMTPGRTAKRARI